MYQGETPTLMIDAAPLVFDEFGMVEMVLTLEHVATGEQLELTDDRLTVTGPLVLATLTQAETLGMRGRVKAQLNVLCEDGRRIASEQVAFSIGSNLKDEVMQ